MPFALQNIQNGAYGTQPWQTFNAWWPQAAGRYRVFVIVHGGAWAMYNKDAMNDLCVALAAKGAVTFTVGYKLSAPGAPSWPQCSNDLIAFDAWLRASNFGCADVSNITYYGGSSGGHLALISTCRGLAPTRVVGNCPPLDLTGTYPTWLEPYIAQMIGTASRAEASPSLQLAAKAPSTKWVVLQADGDTAIVPGHLTALIASANTNGIPLLYSRLPGTHCFLEWPTAALNWPEYLWQLSIS